MPPTLAKAASAASKRRQKRAGKLARGRFPLWAVYYDGGPDNTVLFTAHRRPAGAPLRAVAMGDFLLMFHIMDYEEREDVNTTLLRVASRSLGTPLP